MFEPVLRRHGVVVEEGDNRTLRNLEAAVPGTAESRSVPVLHRGHVREEPCTIEQRGISIDDDE